MSFGYLDAAGINVTAVKAGNEVVHLEVLTKSNQKLVSGSKYLDILEDISLELPRYINSLKDDAPTSIIMAPLTRYSFEEHITVLSECTLLSIGERRNQIESGRRVGSACITLSRSGHRPITINVQVKPIMGVFIDNSEGFISLDTDETITVPIYLQDNNGRLMISPLEHLDIVASTLNSGVIEIQLTAMKDAVIIRSKEQGIGMLTISLPEYKLVDSLIVSVGSVISPGRQVKVLREGTVQFGSIYNNEKWISSNPKIASIDSHTGLVRAHSIGTTKISYGQLTSILEVKVAKSLEQMGAVRYKG